MKAIQTLKFGEKYVYITPEKSGFYFEHFKGKDSHRRVIELSIESREGRKFLKENDGKVLDMDINWFGRKIKGKPMFIYNEMAFSYVVIILPSRNY